MKVDLELNAGTGRIAISLADIPGAAFADMEALTEQVATLVKEYSNAVSLELEHTSLSPEMPEFEAFGRAILMSQGHLHQACETSKIASQVLSGAISDPTHPLFFDDR